MSTIENLNEGDFQNLERSFPAGYRAAEAASASGQQGLKRSSAIAFSLLVLTAAAGLFESRAAGWIAAAAFAVSGLLMALAIVKNFEMDWYDGRAAAESLKTDAWKYAVGGEPFAKDREDAETDWRNAVKGVLDELKLLNSELELDFSDSPDQLLHRLRAADFSTRRGVYLNQRVLGQRNWYSRRSNEHATTASRIEYVGLALQMTGILLAVAKGLGWVDVDLLSVAAASVAGLYAWLGVGDYKSVARSYQFAALELDRALAAGSGVSAESEWATYVADAEAAMSREHTMWVSRRRGG